MLSSWLVLFWQTRCRLGRLSHNHTGRARLLPSRVFRSDRESCDLGKIVGWNCWLAQQCAFRASFSLTPPAGRGGFDRETEGESVSPERESNPGARNARPQPRVMQLSKQCQNNCPVGGGCVCDSNKSASLRPVTDKGYAANCSGRTHAPIVSVVPGRLRNSAS